MDSRAIKRRVSEGYLHVRAIIEVVGKPKEYVEEALEEHLKKIREDKLIELIKESSEAAEERDGLFSAFGDIELLLKDYMALIYFCFDYLPSSIELIEPEDIMMKNNELTGFLNDLQTRLHALNTGMIQARDQSSHYVKNTAVLLRNFIVVLLSQRPMAAKDVVQLTGIREEDVLKVIDVLIKEGKVKKEGGKYIAVPKK